ncbi:MAG TPA: cupin domain-containing protein [Dongiaceae bacterium]|nr:cupin domain-containing protein [Dongiaceae bacterium]
MIDSWTQEAAARLKLPLSDVPAAQRIAGSPQTGAKGLGQFGNVNVGVWEMTPGTMSDTEVDEIFVVLHGAAEVEFKDGAPMTLKQGDVVRLHAGQQTVWKVTETLRKVYVSLRS